jgi:hypothetical protein
VEFCAQDFQSSGHAFRLSNTSDNLRQRVSHGIQSVNVESNLRAAQRKAHPGTGNWFIEGTDFKQWMLEERSLLWLNGIGEFCV